MEIISVHTSSPYDVLVGNKILPDCGKAIAKVHNPCLAAIITDDNVSALYLSTVVCSLKDAGFRVCSFVVPHGEDSKSHSVLLNVYDFLIEQQVTRSDLLVALGGGVVGDLVGYAAATYLRGVPFIQIPTTFLAAVDSSVGGKTAVNIPAGKNLIGAFHQPSLVFCDTDLFKTLPQHVFADGSAEMIKYGLIYDKEFFEFLETGDIHENMCAVVARCVDMKRKIVEQDERDIGLRMILNFGHTLGHAIEKVTNHEVTHGNAVAMGIVLIQTLGEKLGIGSHDLTERIIKCLSRYNLPTDYKGCVQDLASACLNDKKRSGDNISLIFVSDPGKAITKPIPVEDFFKLCGGM